MNRWSRRTFLKKMGLTGAYLASSASFLASCGGAAAPAPATEEAAEKAAAAPPQLADLTMQAAWINDAEFMGYFVGLAQGFYEAEGIKLTYLSGGPDIIPETTLLTGAAGLALTTLETVVAANLEQGANFKFIGTQYQKSPIGIVSLPEKPINTIADLAGKTLAVPSVNLIAVEETLKLNDIDPAEVKIVPYQYDPTVLIKGEVDATLDFVTSVPFAIKAETGIEPITFLLYDYGFKVPNDLVAVTEDYLKANRGLLVSWLRASRRGWEENFKDIEGWPKKFEASWFKGTGRPVEAEISFNKAQQSLIEHPDGIFTMTDESIGEYIDVMKLIGLEATREMFVTDLLQEI